MIADLCKKHDVLAVMDEVYEWIVYSGSKHVRMSTWQIYLMTHSVNFISNIIVLLSCV